MCYFRTHITDRSDELRNTAKQKSYNKIWPHLMRIFNVRIGVILQTKVRVYAKNLAIRRTKLHLTRARMASLTFCNLLRIFIMPIRGGP